MPNLSIRLIDNQPFIVATAGKRETVSTLSEFIAGQRQHISTSQAEIAGHLPLSESLDQQIAAALIAGTDSTAPRILLAENQKVIAGLHSQIADAEQSIEAATSLVDECAADAIRAADALALEKLTSPLDRILQEHHA